MGGAGTELRLHTLPSPWGMPSAHTAPQTSVTEHPLSCPRKSGDGMSVTCRRCCWVNQIQVGLMTLVDCWRPFVMIYLLNQQMLNRPCHGLWVCVCERVWGIWTCSGLPGVLPAALGAATAGGSSGPLLSLEQEGVMAGLPGGGVTRGRVGAAGGECACPARSVLEPAGGNTACSPSSGVWGGTGEVWPQPTPPHPGSCCPLRVVRGHSAPLCWEWAHLLICLLKAPFHSFSCYLVSTGFVQDLVLGPLQ